MNDIGSIIGVGVDLDVHLLGCVEMVGVVDSLRFVLVIANVVADEVEGEILVRHEWLLRKKGGEGTYRSAFENGFACEDGKLGFAAVGDFGAGVEGDRGVDDWPTDAKFFLIAPTVAVVAAEAFVFRFLAWRLAAPNTVLLVVLEAGKVAGAAAEQLWSVGKRWAGQNCSLHF